MDTSIIDAPHPGSIERHTRRPRPVNMFFSPKAIAVIGASETPGSVGRTVLWNLVSSPFGGTVYPVNAKRSSVLGIKSYPSLAALPEPIDLAVVITPAPTVPDIIAECVDTGVSAALIISAGFRETGPDGLELEQRVIEQARRAIEAGADGIVVTAPFYALNNQAEIAEHFRMVAAAVEVPVFAYDVPVRLGGVKLAPETLVQLGVEGVIAGVKDSSGDDVSFRRLIAYNKAAGSPLLLFTGHEMVCDAMALAGADGLVPGFANVDATRYRQLWDAAQSGDWASAVALQEQINAEFEIVFKPVGRGGDGTGVGAFKIAMQALGRIASARQPRPLGDFSEHDVAAVREVLVKTGLLK